jgi:hypothetical protein
LRIFREPHHSPLAFHAVPTIEAAKKACLIIGYKVFQASPKSPDQPNVYLEISFKNMAAYAGDIGDQATRFKQWPKK